MGGDNHCGINLEVPTIVDILTGKKNNEEKRLVCSFWENKQTRLRSLALADFNGCVPLEKLRNTTFIPLILTPLPKWRISWTTSTVVRNIAKCAINFIISLLQSKSNLGPKKVARRTLGSHWVNVALMFRLTVKLIKLTSQEQLRCLQILCTLSHSYPKQAFWKVNRHNNIEMQ